MEVYASLKDVGLKLGNKQLLRDITFDIKKQTITTLIGQNGAGKTTIAKLLLGLLVPTEGVLIRNRNLKIGYAPQKVVSNHYLPLKAAELLNLISPKFDTKLLQDFNEYIEILPLMHEDVSSLSGGQMQKLILIASMLSLPDFLILDEPTQYLDLNTQKKFYKLIKVLKDKYFLTIFMISHDLFTVMKNSDQVICLNGHICCHGKPSELKNNIQMQNALSEIGLYVHDHDHDHDHNHSEG